MASSSLLSAARGVCSRGLRRTTGGKVGGPAPPTCPPTPSLVLSRAIAGKAMRQEIPDKPKPFPYETREFNLWWYLMFERTTLRMDENSKVVVVQGADGVGKEKFAKELADELGMKHFPRVDLDGYYKSPYGDVDLRDYNKFLMPRLKTYDEKDFVRDPTAVHGCVDRFTFLRYTLKFRQYVLALRHLFNTGQGVVLESNPYSDYCFMEACYNAGWMERTSRKYMKLQYKNSLHHLLRPNLLIYLDAPTDVVQKKVAARGNEWDKDSPVWSNTEFLNDVYGSMKRDYLKKAQPHSHVLVYDWTEPGETEIVVEDIEKLNFDYYGQFEEPQKDWRLYNDEYATKYRLRYSRRRDWSRLMASLGRSLDFDAEELHWTAEENINFEQVAKWIPKSKYMYGYNSDAGDKWVPFKFGGAYYASDKDWSCYVPKVLKKPWEPALNP